MTNPNGESVINNRRVKHFYYFYLRFSDSASTEDDRNMYKTHKYDRIGFSVSVADTAAASSLGRDIYWVPLLMRQRRAIHDEDEINLYCSNFLVGFYHSMSFFHVCNAFLFMFDYFIQVNSTGNEIGILTIHN